MGWRILVCTGEAHARSPLQRTFCTHHAMPSLPMQHAISGSIAGLAEHSVMFPIDTVKTLMQTRHAHLAEASLAADSAGIAPVSMAASIAELRRSGGLPRMWRGVQTMFSGCVPAHAAYFSVYESSKSQLSAMLHSNTGEGAPSGSGSSSSGDAIAAGAAVALATMVHDVIMTPMDCIKQRLQLGYHQNSLVDCACAMMRQEGPRAFMLSYPTTLLMNVPYALIMGSTNEAIRKRINPEGRHSLGTYMMVRPAARRMACHTTHADGSPMSLLPALSSHSYLPLLPPAFTSRSYLPLLPRPPLAAPSFQHPPPLHPSPPYLTCHLDPPIGNAGGCERRHGRCCSHQSARCCQDTAADAAPVVGNSQLRRSPICRRRERRKRREQPGGVELVPARTESAVHRDAADGEQYLARGGAPWVHARRAGTLAHPCAIGSNLLDHVRERQAPARQVAPLRVNRVTRAARSSVLDAADAIAETCRDPRWRAPARWQRAVERGQ